MDDMTDWRRSWRVWLLVAVPFLLPFGRSSEAPLLIGAICGLVAMARRQIAWRSPAVRLALVLFLGYWLPELLSAFDSYAREKTWQEAAIDMRFLPFLLFATTAVRTRREASLLTGGVAAIVLLWCTDALLQAATGLSLGGAATSDRLSGIFGADDLKLGGALAVLSPFALLWCTDALLQAATGLSLGGAATSDRLSGIFGADDLKLGGALAVLSPFALLWCARNAGTNLALVAALPVAVVILLAGARASWFGFVLGTALVLWNGFGSRRALPALGVFLIAAAIAGVVGYHVSDRFAQRVDRTAAAFTGDEAAIDHALSGRLPIWSTALRMAEAHPVNGVGVRGFRHAYPDYAAADDPWVDEHSRQGAMHAHQLVLEVASETGLIGLLSWIGAAIFALWCWRKASAEARHDALPAAFALIVMLFPFNTHYAMYSAVWGLLLMAMSALWIAGLAVRR
jgi:O-antigen ligase